MRSLYTALALCAVTLVMSGCASQLAGTYDSSCTTCDSCNTAPVTTVSDCGCGDTGCGGACQAAPVEGGCNSCGQKCGGRCGMKSRPMAMQRTAAPMLARGRIFGAKKQQGCGGTGCGGCQDCGAAPAGMSGVYTGGFQACSICGKADCRGCGKSRTPTMGYGGSPYGMGMPTADSCGCGKFGCGQGGQLCLRCRVKNGIGQRADQATGGDCGCDSGACGNGGCGLAGLGFGGMAKHGSGNHPFVDRLRAKGCGAAGCGDGGQPCASCLGGGGGMQGGCGAPGCGNGGQPCASCLGGGGGMQGGCGAPGCGVGGKPCASCLGGGGGMYGGCGAPGCGVGGQPCSNCLSRMHGGHLHKKAAHLLPAQHPYGGAIPHTELQPGMGGQAPTYAYPYYTTRGPRDFLQNNPPTIGY